MLPFWLSITVLSMIQGSVVALAGAPALERLRRLGGRGYFLLPPLSVIAFVFIARVAERASARGLTYLALVAVPVLAALALGWLARGARPERALVVVPLFALAWLDRGGLAGEGAAVALSALSCVALGVLLAAVTPPRWLAAGIIAMAVADTALVVSDLLQRPNDALNAAHPAAGLPRLQSAVFGTAVMGYGDLFVAGALGGLLALAVARSLQVRAAALVALMGLCFDVLFFFLDELPATVPVALALAALLLARRREEPLSRRATAPAASARSRLRGLGPPAGRPPAADLPPGSASGPGPAHRSHRARAAP
jgi:hypothetical protein